MKSGIFDRISTCLAIIIVGLVIVTVGAENDDAISIGILLVLAGIILLIRVSVKREKEKGGVIIKSKTTAYLLWLFFGIFGGHKFYLNKIGMGVVYIFTGGLLIIGWIVDLFTLGRQVDQYNANPPASLNQNSWKPSRRQETDPDKFVFISYEDAEGSYSDRLIEVHRFYKKGDEAYIDAYCFIRGDDRTFRVDRIFNLQVGSKNGPEVAPYDYNKYFSQLFKKSGRKKSAEDLAGQAAED